MGWRGTIVLSLLVVVVGAYIWFADSPTTPAGPPNPLQNQPPQARSAPTLRKLLVFEPAEVVGLQLQRAGQTRTVERQAGAWQGIEDPTAINDFLHTLSTLGVLMDIPTAVTELADYGLDRPRGVITLHVDGQAQPLVVQIGERNPATTGVYVRIGESGPVALAGALVEWEFDKLFRRLSQTG
jgi:hypothetical protein